ncbi:hypothetical protein GGR50DRAFT_221070 [Xylaria sp. CBS 124048]|nr:hypothetical protein GGR50DRAFT_221070 [Xylaria sp. CBS 124048]
MQFTVLALAALSMGFAAAQPLGDGLPGGLPSENALASTGSALANKGPNVINGGSGVFSRDLPAAPQNLESTSSLIRQSESVIQAQATLIDGLVRGEATPDIAIKIQTSLVTVGLSLNGLLDPVIALTDANAVALSQDQIATVPSLLEEVLQIVLGVQSIAKSVAAIQGKTPEVAAQSELQYVLGTVGIVTNHAVSFTRTAIPTTSPIYAKVSGIINSLEYLVAGLLGPITRTVDQILHDLL